MNKILLPASHPFAGIAEKINRSYENIRNLEAEVARFFEESEYPVLSDDNEKLIREAVEYHAKRPIPLRFSVLAGEIVHHLRSCLDHIVWHFSNDAYRQKHIREIQFPILKQRPSPADVLAKYERKIKGISDSRVLDLIEKLQPYNSRPDSPSLLQAINDYDIVDKHRTLIIVVSSGAFVFPPGMMERVEADESEGPDALTAFVNEFKRDGKLVAQIAFRNFAGREEETVIGALCEMHNCVVGIVARFDKFLT